jgi:hypothetical protein
MLALGPSWQKLILEGLVEDILVCWKHADAHPTRDLLLSNIGSIKIAVVLIVNTSGDFDEMSTAMYCVPRTTVDLDQQVTEAVETWSL